MSARISPRRITFSRVSGRKPLSVARPRSRSRLTLIGLPRLRHGLRKDQVPSPDQRAPPLASQEVLRRLRTPPFEGLEEVRGSEERLLVTLEEPPDGRPQRLLCIGFEQPPQELQVEDGEARRGLDQLLDPSHTRRLAEAIDQRSLGPCYLERE